MMDRTGQDGWTDIMEREIIRLNERLAEAERVLRICANYPPAGMRPQDAKSFFAGFIPAEQRAAREYFTARATNSASGGV